MNLFRIMEEDFVYIHESWKVGQAQSVCRAEKASHVILRDRGFYLFAMNTFLRMLRDLDPGQELRNVAHRLGYEPTPMADAWLDAKQIPDRVIVMRDGTPVGFFDMAIPPSPRVKREARAVCLLAGGLPTKAVKGQTFSVLIRLIGKGGSGMDTLPPGAEIDIVFVARVGLEVLGRSECVLRYDSEEDPLPQQFKIRGIRAGLGTFRVYAFYNGQAVSVLNLSLSILEPEEGEDVYRRDEYEAVVRPPAISQPDLTLLILERSSSELGFTIIANGRQPEMDINFVKYEPVLLKDPSSFSDRLFRDLVALPWHRPSEWPGIMARLEREGERLASKLIPQELRGRIWSLKERLKSIFILSEEPWVPWELCRLNDPDSSDRGFFLSERFWMTRWAPGIPNRLKLVFRKLALVVSGAERGSYLGREKNLLKLFRETGREIETIPSDFYKVRNALASGDFHGWHFAGHAGFNKELHPECDLVFDDRRSLCPSDLTGSLANMGRSQPLVFMNCCHTARQEKVISGVIGWPKQCLQAGASVFVGTFWPIADQSAYQFAETFYRHIFDRRTVGEVAFKSRRHLKKIGNPAWLTYAVYAHPFAAEVEGDTDG